MRNTQINGETFVSVTDVCDWIVVNIDDIRELDSKFADAIQELSDSLRAWGNDDERRRGVPNTQMIVEKR